MGYLTTEPLSWECVAGLERGGAHGRCGALVSFVGLVRGDQPGGRRVRALEYAAYVEMAESQLHRLVTEVTARWSVETVQLRHRLGFVEVGQISVVVIVTAQHRAEAYAASQLLIDHLKHRVPIWKREQYEDGTSAWVGCPREVPRLDDQKDGLHAYV